MNPSTHQKNQSFAPAIAAGILMACSTAHAATLALNPTENTTIRLNTINQGNSPILFVGDTVENLTLNNEFLRSALAFNLNDPLLVGATINSVTLSLFVRTVDINSADEAITINLHELSSTFTTLGATYTSRNGTDNWTTAGGDFGGVLANISGNPKTAAVGTRFDFTGTSFTSAAQASIGNSFDLLVKSATEDTAFRNIFQLRSTRDATTAQHPVLTIDYTAAIPEPSTALLGGLGVLCLLRRRR